ncbi:hypothetical protein P3T35_008123 [Kitasatospora sp. GP30]|uniref:hypothetical protein n=1 Tax=Kitasatospora sp. GP30 TaxID=3035084 RepID=UPI0015D59A88|nr:hypothetical protein [Kitasatospora sp. GP30]
MVGVGRVAVPVGERDPGLSGAFGAFGGGEQGVGQAGEVGAQRKVFGGGDLGEAVARFGGDAEVLSR